MPIQLSHFAWSALLLFSLSGNALGQARYWLAEVQALKVADTAERRAPYQIDTLAPAERQAWRSLWSRQPASEFWNEEATRLVVKFRVNPLRAGRALALLHVAMHDAAARTEFARIQEPGQAAASHAAAAAMLTHLFPLEPLGRFEALGESALAALSVERPGDTRDLALAADIGKRVARLVILNTLNDGADEVWDARSKPSLQTAMWRPTPPLDSAHPQEPLAGQWKTWVLEDGAQVQPPAPALDPQALTAAANEVLEVSRHLSPEQKQIAEYWHLDKGTVTPPGLWNHKARELAEGSQMGEKERLRMLAALNIAMQDAAIACWQAKYSWWVPRPVTVIRESLDPSFTPYLVTPPHPSYVSGHASVSGAAAEVLKAFFAKDANRIDGWAEEAAMSRLYGGIHYRADNDAGLDLGHRIGRRVVERIAGPRPADWAGSG